MNQEERIVKVHLESRGNLDYLVFEFENEKIVCMNDENCQSNLKSVFTMLLQYLLLQPIKLEYEQRIEYKQVLYIDVCTEYIKELNREITSVRKNIPEKLKTLKIL